MGYKVWGIDRAKLKAPKKGLKLTVNGRDHGHDDIFCEMTLTHGPQEIKDKTGQKLTILVGLQEYESRPAALVYEDPSDTIMLYDGNKGQTPESYLQNMREFFLKAEW